MDGNARRTNSASAMVQLFFDYLSGIRDPARTPVRYHNYCAGRWAATCIQKPSVPDPCGDLFNQRPHHERAADHPQPNAAFRRHLHLHHVRFRLALHWLADSHAKRGYQGRLDRYRYAGVPLLAYAVLLSGGVVLRRGGQVGLDLVAAGMVILLNAAIQNSWSIAISVLSSEE
jgi:hypothetical protein